MDTHQNAHNRRSIRLQDFDYSQAGAYCLTICTHERICLFGEVVEDQMLLNDAGRMAECCWSDIPTHFPHVGVDAFVVMPNHVHGIIVITNKPVGAKNFSPLPDHNASMHRSVRSPSKTIGSVVRGFKIGVTRGSRENGRTNKIWQRNYFEHVIAMKNR